MDLDDEELEATRKLHGIIKDEIKVGDYVRNKEGKIIKVDWVGQAIVTDVKGFTFSKLSGEIVNHSKNIIDLIEEGE